MLEVKADPLEASFEALERQDEDVAQLREEMAQLKSRIDAQAVAASRPALSGAQAERSPFVENYLRRGVEAGVELKALAGTSDSAGGYAVPEEIDARIDRTLTAISPIRAIANVVKVGSAGYRKLVTTGGTPSGWVAEDAARIETDTPVFAEIAPPFGELYANPAATQAMLDDAAFDVEGWLADEIATEFARAEGAAFVGGSGINRPKGFLQAPVSAAAALPAGRGVRDEFGDRRTNPQVQDERRRIPVAAGPDGGPAEHIARLSRGRSRGHARHRGRQPVDRLRPLQGRLSDRGADRDADPARSLQPQAVCPLLRDQAGRRAGGQFGGDQADEIQRLTENGIPLLRKGRAPRGLSPGPRGATIGGKEQP